MAEEIAITTAAGLASNATESGYDLLKQQISYMFKYQSYINDLKKQVEDLRNKRETVEKPVESAERQGEEIYKAVKKWLSDVDEFTERVEKAIIEDEDKANKGGCFKLGSCPNLIQRYKLGKQAMKAKIDGADLLGKGNFSSVSYRPALQRTESMYVRDYETFDSREQAFQEIMEALQDVNVNMIGVYGMGGVGKTTLVKKVAWEAKKNKLFDEVVIAEATQTPDYKKIQEKVAYELGLEFRQEGEYQRTDLLREKIKKQKNLLIILDNIWTKLDLDKIGIPFGGVGREKDEKIRPCTKVDLDAIGIPLGDVEREKDEKIRPCTILLTSRNRDLLSKDMKTQKDIFIGPLSNGDAWNMFCKIVGDAAESSDFRPVADEIVKKCDGLPVAISLIANALKNESLHAWDDALAQLKKSNPRHILGMNETLYSMTKLSYEFLKNEEAKSLFLLCALHNAGDSVFIDDLLKYSMGWNLFEVVYTLEEGRNRLHRLIDHLKASCLLEDGTYDNSVKMHDIIHAVAVSIASAEKLMFNIQNFTDLKEVLGERISKDSTAISLPYRNINDDLPERLEYPKLKLFFLFGKNRSPQIADAFFEKMKELRVLSVHGLRFLPLPSSISFLKNLQTLFLKSCILGDIRILGELSKLAILSLVESNIEELPAEIGQLTRLKLLDLSNCLSLKYIATNVISSLSQLEELYMGNSFVEWEVEGVDNQGRRNASLEELKRLSNLTTLHLHIQDARVMPQDLFFKKLKSYKIFIGDEWKWSIKFDLSTSRMLKLKIDDSIHLQHGVKSLLKMTEDLSLEGMSGVRNVIYELSVDGFPQLKHLCVKNDLELLYIINSVAWKLVFPNLESLILRNLIKLENICHGQLNAGSFRKLRIIKIEKCDRLKYLFAFFMAKNLVQLQEIEVSDCKDLKEIFGEENNDHGDEIETNNQTELNQLCSLALQRLPKFITIGSDMRVVVPRLENLKVCSINFENTCIHQPLAMFHYSQCLKSLTVEDCNGLKFLLSSSMVKSLNQLQKLLISNCKSMEVIIDSEGVQKEEKIVDMSFPKLLYMKLEVLPKLTSFGTGNLIEFPFLKELHIEHCPNLKAFFCKSFYPEIEGKPKEEVNSENDFININPLFDEKVAFPSLEKMVLLHLDSLHLIWHNQTLQVDSFCKLKVVRVEYCKKLLTIVPSNSQGHLTFHNLEILEVRNCWSMKSLFPVSTATGLVQLKKLWISSCGLEKIVSEGEVNGAPIFLFPQLTRIHLENLRELKCFYPRLHAVDWPMLSSLGVYKCKNINLYASEFPSFQAREAERQPALFLLEKVIPNLEVLGLDSHDFRLTFLYFDQAKSFGKLKNLWLANFDDEFVGSLFDFLKKLNCLESLGFADSSFEELFPYEQGHIWKQDFLGNTFLPNLQKLRVRRCHCLTILMPSAMYFKNLETLEVYNCNGLAKVLTSEATKTLVNLTTMRIRECKLLIEVIANQGDKEEEVVFGQLEVLELHCLSNLAFFCSANYSFKFPCLEQVIVSQCPKLNIFSQGVSSTPLLKKVQLSELDDDVEYFWKDDLNSTIQQIFTDMIGFRKMEYVKLSEFPTLKEKIWNEGLPVSLFCNLKWLVLDEDFDKSTALPFHAFSDLRNLETLEVRNYHSLEDLFDVKGKTIKNSKEEIFGFNNLKSLKVHSCSGLRYIFTPAIILGLDQLQKIEVKNCALIEEIITKDGGKEGAIDKIFIPHLNSIVLELLPDLTNFYSGTNYLECPSLKRITIANCPKMETFVFSDLKTDHLDHNAPLFSEKVAFPSLEKMVLLHLDNLQLIWHNQKLHVESFCKLKVVRVEFCEKLLTIVPSSTQGRLTFHNLESLKVKNCWSLKSLFSASIAIGLVQLKELQIYSCGLEKIVSEEEVNGAPTFLFPHLTNVHLENLRELKCFYPRLHTIEWPMLRSLGVYKCKKIKLYAPEFPSLQARDRERQPAPFLLEKVIPNLEVVGLDAYAFKLAFLLTDGAESFTQLKILRLCNFDDESIASLLNFLQKLSCLESLDFSGSSFKELFPYEQGHIWKQDFQLRGNTFLQNLQVCRCHCLTILIPSATSFNNLKSLEICNCNGLAKVLTSEATKTLINLTTMRIRECKLLTEVIANDGDREEEIVFGKLEVLELYCLSSLTFFCSANYSFQFPCLEQVIVSQCPKLNIFSEGVLNTPLLKKVQLTESNNDKKYFWKDDLNSTVQQIFMDMIGFRNIEYFKFSEFPPLKEKIWSGGFPVSLFCNLKWLVLDEVFDLSSAFPSHVFYNLRNLETLEVRNHHSLKDLFDIKGKTLKNSKEEILGFNNLKSLKVHNCSSLRYMLTPSIILGLHQLKEIEVKNCALIEEIITEDEGKKGAIDKIFIPHLNSIVLELLPDLTNFYSGTNYLECPSLKSITIANCPKIETFVFSDLKTDYFDHNASLFSEKVAFPSLEKMVLLHLDNLQLIWHNQKLHVESFCKLKVVRVEFCEKLLTIVPSNTQGRLTFYNLESLKVKNCWSLKSLLPVSIAIGLLRLKDLWINSCGLEKIVSEEEVNGAPTFLFPQLTNIHLDNLRELKCFYPRLHTIEWPMLRSLNVYKCNKIKVYAAEFPSFQARDGESQPALFLLEKVIPNLEVLGLDAHDFSSTFLHSDLAESFGQLKILNLGNFDDESIASLFNFLQKLNFLESFGFYGNSFKELFLYEQGFQGNTFLPNLQRLQVYRCHYMTILMSSATSFKNLKTLVVCNCDGLALVLTSEAVKTLINLTTMRIRECKLLTEVIANDGDREDEIVFGKLKVLELYCLSSLTFFCSANYSFEFPCLEQVIVSQCPKLNIFSEGVLTTPLLKKVQLTKSNNDGEYFWTDDLNSTVQQIFTDMIGFRNIEYFKFSEFPTLKEKIWSGGFQVGLFCNLKWLVLDEVFDLSSAFPSHVFYNLRNLETLEVRNHHSLKDLFDMKGKTLKNSKEEILGFNNLKSLKVHNCSSLRYMLTPSIISGLHQLKEIEVKNCALIEEIITEDEGKKGAIDKIFIPHLKSIVIELLPDLTNFCSGTNYLGCPSLESITIVNCPKMKTFVFTDLKDHFDHNAPLFSEKVAFPSLEKMVLLHLGNLQLIWHNQRLHVESFCRLKVVKVEFCEKLLSIVPSNNQGHLTFHNLESLNVKNCWSMKSLFPVSIATGLVQLKELQIYSCGLEKIVSGEEVNKASTFLFPRLTHIHLEHLPELKCFYPQLHAIEWPMLRRLGVYKCKKIKLYAPEFPSLQARDRERQPAPFLLEKVIPNLEVVGLDALAFKLAFLLTHLAESFAQLKILWLRNFDDESIASLFDFLEKLNCLESLGFSGSSFKELFPYEQGHIWKQDFQGNTFLQNLQKLQVRRCHGLTILMSSATSFSNLKTLEVYNCNGLAKVLTSEAIKTLVNLTTMRIRECKLLTEIIADEGKREEEIVLGELKILELYSLSSLAFFCSANCSFQFPCLEQVIVSQCPKLSIFSRRVLHTPLLKKVQLMEQDGHQKYFWKEDLNSTIKQMFSDMVVLPSLETSSYFHNLTILVIDGFDHLQYLFPSSMVSSLIKLRELEISNCMLMERVIDEDEGRTEMMLFPKLYQLKLRDLPQLTTFCNSTANSVEMSSLFRLWIDNCPGIETFISSYVYGDMTLSSKEPEGMSAKENSTHVPSLFDQKVRLPSLERLRISHADQLVKLWNNQVSMDSFNKLNRLFLRFCKNLASVFPSNMLGKHQKLEFLEVQNCDSVEEIFEVLEKRSSMMEEIFAKGEAVPRFVFSKLAHLSLEMLPSLKSFYPDMHISEWPILEDLKVYGCNNVEILASELLSIPGSHGDSQQPLFFIYKDAFPSLEKLELCGMPRLKHLWRGNFQPCNAFQNLQTLKVSECDSLENSWCSSLTFRNLTTLQVSKCDGLRYLLTPSKTKTLGQLTRMNVSDCKQMEEIITHLGDEVMENSIVFSKLGCLELHCLSSLKSFCCGDYSLEFLSLKKVIVRQCLEMETFCHGILSTPKLERLQLTEGEDEVEECWEGNLNSTIQYLYNNTKVWSSKED
ncbi:uncharacterized protein LOC123210160 isoform X2 [Mangifera indica]|uniref:uncharacterized protein LOC123210160 isoform X2 n=1 Tax=Mangifera indica TaxID=29780 RepID=UPI001CFB10E5|nr:uncharacterized protein LOC123210160 isoform X2 [Mangifera indica]